jgi:hypothetical protein
MLVALVVLPWSAVVEVLGLPVVQRCAGSMFLGEPIKSQLCPPAGELIVKRSKVTGLVVPLRFLEIGRNKATIFAEFSGSWAESRKLFLVLRNDGMLARASLFTDYGCWECKVDSEQSWVHQHSDRVCFSLRVECLDGMSTFEDWRGQLNTQ